MSQDQIGPVASSTLIQVLGVELTPQSVLVIMPEPEHYLTQKLIDAINEQLEQFGIRGIVLSSHVQLTKIERASE